MQDFVHPQYVRGKDGLALHQGSELLVCHQPAASTAAGGALAGRLGLALAHALGLLFGSPKGLVHPGGVPPSWQRGNAGGIVVVAIAGNDACAEMGRSFVGGTHLGFKGNPNETAMMWFQSLSPSRVAWPKQSWHPNKISSPPPLWRFGARWLVVFWGGVLFPFCKNQGSKSQATNTNHQINGYLIEWHPQH